MSSDYSFEIWIIFALFLTSLPYLHFLILTIREACNQHHSRSTVKWELLILLIPAYLAGLSSSTHK